MNKLFTICSIEVILIWIEFYIGYRLLTAFSDDVWYMPPYIITCYLLIFLVGYLTSKTYDSVRDFLTWKGWI